MKGLNRAQSCSVWEVIHVQLWFTGIKLIVSHFCLTSYFCPSAVKNMTYGTIDSAEKDLWQKEAAVGNGWGWHNDKHIEKGDGEGVGEREHKRNEWQLIGKIPVFILK